MRNRQIQRTISCHKGAGVCPSVCYLPGSFFIFLFTSLACEMGDMLQFPQTLMAPSPTIEITPTVNPDDIGVVSVLVDKKLIRIIMDPLGERDIDFVSTAVIDMGEAYLIENIDTLGRYLPSVEIIARDREPVQVVEAVQTHNNWQWSFKTGENLAIIPLMKTFAGTVALGSLHQFSTFQGIQFGINLIMPIPDEVDDLQIYAVYHTPGNNTFLLIPEGLNAGRGSGLASFAPQDGLFPEYVIFSFMMMPGAPITDYIRAA
ncbi:MAG: hypothetical protein MUO76_02725 [Anaerolineaceae bacterium]|nr:hypothetical protein [Anaerolineaceae bacterium]